VLPLAIRVVHVVGKASGVTPSFFDHPQPIENPATLMANANAHSDPSVIDIRDTHSHPCATNAQKLLAVAELNGASGSTSTFAKSSI
jgi:hypothetical protein